MFDGSGMTEARGRKYLDGSKGMEDGGDIEGGKVLVG